MTAAPERPRSTDLRFLSLRGFGSPGPSAESSSGWERPASYPDPASPIAGYSEALGLFELLRTTIRFTPALSPAVAIAEPR